MEHPARSYVTLAIGCMIVLVLGACNKTEPVRIGFVGGLTGRSADLGVAGRNGAMLAVEERNAAGGIKGRHVELVVRDDSQDPAAAITGVSELCGKQVEIIVGPMTSSMAMAVVPIVNASRTILISPTVTTSDLSGKDDNFFRVISDTREYASKNATYQYRKLGLRRAAAIYDLNNRAYTESWLNHFRTTFEELGGRMVAVKDFKSGNSTVFSGSVKELLAARPDLIVIVGNAVDAAMICQQIRKVDSGTSLTLSEWASTDRLLELGGTAVEGAYLDQYVNRDDHSPRYSAFLRKYRDRFGLEPGFAGVAAYDAVMVAMETLAQKRTDQSAKEALLAVGTFKGIQEQVSFDRFGDARRKTYVNTIRNGSFVTME